MHTFFSPRTALLRSLFVALCIGVVFGLPTAWAEDNIPTNDAGLRHGRVTLEHPNGQTRVQASYREGQLHGTYREFSDTGQLIITATFSEGKLHGRVDRRTADGDRLEIARYRAGVREGTRQVFADGQLVLTETYEDGECTAQEGDTTADPSPLVFAIGADGLAGAAPSEHAAEGQRDGGDEDDGRANQRDTSVRPAGYPYSIDELVRAFERLDEMEIENTNTPEQAVAVRQLIRYRIVCNVPHPIVEHDLADAHLAQRATEVFEKIGRWDHHPPNPGLPDDVYREAAEGARRSNVGGPRYEDPADALQMWVVDFGAHNRDEIGHRRWFLTPGLTKIGYGTHLGYVAALVNGNTNDNVDYDIITCPGRGYQPIEMYDMIERIPNDNLIWSIHPNPAKFTIPESTEEISITVVRLLEDGEREDITIDRTRIAEENFPVEAILFEPAIESFTDRDRYEVRVEGLRRRGQRPAPYVYRVEFIAMD